MNGVGQGAVLFEFREREQDLFDFFGHSGRQQAARTDQRVASPIQKPRITGDDGFAFAAADDELFRGAQKLLFKRDGGTGSAC